MKMHGLGNDFVVLDARAQPAQVSPVLARALGDRHRGVGFDQMAIISHQNDAVHLTFYNADGSTSAACGNATRCIARHLMSETGTSAMQLTTDSGTLSARVQDDGAVSVNMGQPSLEWADIPLSHEMDTLHVPMPGDPVATGMGNPHCTFFVKDAEAVDLEAFGAEHEHHEFYPERTNVQVVTCLSPNRIRMRVWERGVGVTLASGSSSCAAAVAAHRRGLTVRQVQVDLDGGTLSINWAADGVWMTGPTQHVFSGVLTADFLRSVT